uniref:uncharacterized protein LOC100176916 isoform X2 n=1 Tax=Ciona intestinalis TaxID=7719 RepID=UPI000EF51730|nr:uncharacterized protein LOC100176916 isoform X2 [Ciona intestinalis]|eukprot:XP_026692873.1 uncharacterized protein LOC100176916 isoform X2 [Ciona intestinalis]
MNDNEEPSRRELEVKLTESQPVPADDEINNDDETTHSTSNEHITTHEQNVDTVDTIGVTLDYEPPTSNIIITTDEQSFNNPDELEQTERRSRTHQPRNEVGIVSFYSRHWFGQCVSGVFTGIIFLSIGIVFIVYFQSLPIYIGILFILVSIPPCCMAANRYKYAMERQRRYERRQRSRLAREQIRAAFAQSEANRPSQLPMADFPPSYSNLAFDVNEQEDTWTNCSSEVFDSALPSYADFIQMKKQSEEEIATVGEQNQTCSLTSEESGENSSNRE